MKQNVLNFQSDIKTQVTKQKETGDCEWWMHPAYCAYYILKHGIDPQEYIDLDIEKSYKALPDDYHKRLFKKEVESYLDKYAEIICADQQ